MILTNRWVGADGVPTNRSAGDVLGYYDEDRRAFVDPDKALQVINQEIEDQESAIKIQKWPLDPYVVIAIHGYNCTWEDSLRFFDRVRRSILAPTELQAGAGPRPSPVMVGLSWASAGMVADYLGDRRSARAAAEHMARVLQRITDFRPHCNARVSVVAHSMGCYLLAQAARIAWEEMGRPGSHVVLQEACLVAADLDGDALGVGGEAERIPAFARRTTVYYSRRDSALLASATKRLGVTGERLGRQGISDRRLVPPSVIDVDCTGIVSEHGGYFDNTAEGGLVAQDLFQVIAIGADRSVIQGRYNGPTDNSYRLGFRSGGNPRPGVA